MQLNTVLRFEFTEQQKKLKAETTNADRMGEMKTQRAEPDSSHP